MGVHRGFILNARGLLRQGAEIGVFQGDFSEWILQHWRGRCLHSVDPWVEFPADKYQDLANVSQRLQEAHYDQTRSRLAPFGTRSRIARCTSAEAASHFGPGELDFVYIDAQHHYEAVRDDIALWRSKIRPGGIIAGHDYFDGKVESGLYGVKRAVTEFVSGPPIRRLLVSRESDSPSWIVLL